MKKKISLSSAIVLLLLASLLTFQLTYSFVGDKYQEKVDALTHSDNDFSKLSEVEDFVRANFIGTADETHLSDSTVEGYLQGLNDPYALYLTAEEYSAYQTDKSGAGTGIGLRVTYDDESNSDPVIYSVFPNSPASEAGIEKGDVLFSVDGNLVSEIGSYSAVSLIAGDAGTSVSITVKRMIGAEARELDYTLMRREIAVPSIEFEMLEGDIAFIQIYTFGAQTATEFKTALDGLSAAGAKALILDVRNNSGGRLDSVCSILDQLLPSGTILRTYDKNGKETLTQSDENAVDLPMALLMNADSASASEILAAALKDYNAATLIGTKTFGKGTAQTTIALSDGSAIRISTEKFSPPISDSFEGTGVVPDVPVDIGSTNFYLLSHSQDPQLQAAIRAVS